MKTKIKIENDSKRLTNDVRPSLFRKIQGSGDEKFIMLPIDDYEHLGIMKSNLVEALSIIAHSSEYMPPNTDTMGASLAIIEIIKSMSIVDELSGLDKFLSVAE